MRAATRYSRPLPPAPRGRIVAMDCATPGCKASAAHWATDLAPAGWVLEQPDPDPERRVWRCPRCSRRQR